MSFIRQMCVEPISSGAPRIPALTKSYVIERRSGQNVALFIAVQGYPVPSFR